MQICFCPLKKSLIPHSPPTVSVCAVRSHDWDPRLADSCSIFHISTWNAYLANSWFSYFKHYLLTFHNGRLNCYLVIIGWININGYNIGYVNTIHSWVIHYIVISFPFHTKFLFSLELIFLLFNLLSSLSICFSSNGINLLWTHSDPLGFCIRLNFL